MSCQKFSQTTRKLNFIYACFSIFNLLIIFDYHLCRSLSLSSSRSLYKQFNLSLSLTSVCLHEVIDLSACVAVDEFQFIGIEIDLKYFLIELDEGHKSSIKSHFQYFFDIIPSNISHHNHFNFIPLVDLPISHYNNINK